MRYMTDIEIHYIFMFKTPKWLLRTKIAEHFLFYGSFSFVMFQGIAEI